MTFPERDTIEVFGETVSQWQTPDFFFGINGNASDDFLLGTSGDDLMFGNAGNDRLEGLGGNDELTGGAGSDIFIFSGSFGVDTIIDFGSAYTITVKPA